MRQFSAFVRFGDRLVRVDDPDSIAALKAAGDGLVLVHANHGPWPRALRLRLPFKAGTDGAVCDRRTTRHRIGRAGIGRADG